jgi:hypothetical protein
VVRLLIVSTSFVFLLSAQKLPKAELRPETTEAFENYARRREAGLLSNRINGGHFLWADDSTERRDRIRKGEVVIEPSRERGVVEIKGGLIHDWTGAVFIPGVTLTKVLTTIQDYDSHEKLYKPEVVDSKLLERKGNLFKIRLRLLKKKVITVVLNTDHEVTYFPIDATRQYSKSRTTRVAEVEDPGEREEHELTPGDDHGLLWNLNTFWRFLERDGGVWIECEAVSLTRGIPIGLGWLVTPIVRELPRESLTHTLEATRLALR